MIKNETDSKGIFLLNNLIWLFFIALTVFMNGCAAISHRLSQPIIYSDTGHGDPGRVDAKICVMNTIMAPGVRGNIDLSKVTNTVYDVLRSSGSFKKVTIGKEDSDYIVTPTIVDLTDLLDNVVHLRIQTKNSDNNNAVYDHKFVGWNFTQGASLKNIADVLREELPIIRSAIHTDMENILYANKSKMPAITTKEIDTETRPFNNLKIMNTSQKNAKPTKFIQHSPLNEGVRWAIIIGVSSYSDSRIPSLRYAEKDATSLYSWIISPNGGKYAPSRVKLIVGENASVVNIKTALFSWLQKALAEDVVTIYFAGHGAPASPDSPENLFLLPYDCNYDNIAATAFPMWDVETALKRFIKAKKVVVIADACHSGGVGQSYDVARRANRGIKINPISSNIQNLSQISDGICVISASSDSQFSQESQKWGGGHGVFTYFLLKGLKGDADYNKDSSVTLGELTSYLSEQVRRETLNSQSPTVAGRYDPALTIGK